LAACISHDFPSSLIFSAVDLLDSQKFGKLKRAFESGNDGTATISAPPITTASVTSGQANEKTAPAAAGSHKRKAPASTEATKDLPNKKAKQAEEELRDDAALDTEAVGTASLGCEEAQGDQAIGLKLEE